VWEQPAKEITKLQKENQKLEKEVNDLRDRLARSEAEGVVNKVLVSLYDLRHALEKYALENNGIYPTATNINDLQTRLRKHLPENFEVEAVYLERIRSQSKGYIMIASVKGREIVVSNLL
jgi:predicted nuclease with TOPRIM domain